MEENYVSDPKFFFDRDAQVVAKDLLGKVLAHKVDDIWVSARIIETEVYYGKGGILSRSLNKKTKSKCDIKILPGKAL
jgi:DNA-3-methyladenine glycosylase